MISIHRNTQRGPPRCSPKPLWTPRCPCPPPAMARAPLLRQGGRPPTPARPTPGAQDSAPEGPRPGQRAQGGKEAVCSARSELSLSRFPRKREPVPAQRSQGPRGHPPAPPRWPGRHPGTGWGEPSRGSRCSLPSASAGFPGWWATGWATCRSEEWTADSPGFH